MNLRSEREIWTCLRQAGSRPPRWLWILRSPKFFGASQSTELPRQISFYVCREVSDYWLSYKTSFFFPFHPIHTGIDSKASKTERKYEGLMAEMQIEKDFRSE